MTNNETNKPVQTTTVLTTMVDLFNFTSSPRVEAKNVTTSNESNPVEHLMPSKLSSEKVVRSMVNQEAQISSKTIVILMSIIGVLSVMILFLLFSNR